MSWIDKELRKREKLEARAAARQGGVQADEDAAPDGARIQALWDQFVASNDALPEKLRLTREVPVNDGFPTDRSMFLVVLNAKNGACLGYTGDAIRYLWPKKSLRDSNNFWIRWQPGLGLRVSRRVKPSMIRPSTQEAALREPAVDRILRGLVLEKRVTFRSVRKRRWWLF